MDTIAEASSGGTVATAKLAGFATGVWHPEDLVALEGTPWIVVSAMRSMRGRGALLAIDCSGPAPAAIEIDWRPEAEAGRRSLQAFDPHGIDARRIAEQRYELLVVDHGDGEAIDRLTVDLRGGRPVIVGGRQIRKPTGTSGNAVAFLPDGGFVMTSMFDPRDPGFVAKFAEARTTGGVWRWSDAGGWRRIGPDLSGANGIAVTADGHHIVVSEWAARRIWSLSLSGAVETSTDVDFLPDNLRWRPDGNLLVAGQSARPETLFDCEARGGPCPLAFVVAAVAWPDLSVTPLLRISQAEAAQMGFGGATGALDVGSETWVASFTGEKIARFELPLACDRAGRK